MRSRCRKLYFDSSNMLKIVHIVAQLLKPRRRTGECGQLKAVFQMIRSLADQSLELVYVSTLKCCAKVQKSQLIEDATAHLQETQPSTILPLAEGGIACDKVVEESTQTSQPEPYSTALNHRRCHADGRIGRKPQEREVKKFTSPGKTSWRRSIARLDGD